MSIYYSYNAIREKNGVYNFVVGGRGIGKTYGAKKMVISEYIEEGKQFIYLRRYRDELKTLTTFFDDIGREFPSFGFRVLGREMQICYDPDENKPSWETMGYAVALSTAQSRKSTVYDQVHTIIFDEFILEKAMNRYLPDEFTTMNNFYNTVDRWNDRVRVYFLANSVSITNPYFIALDLTADSEWEKRNKGFVVAHYPQSTEFAETVSQTRFGQFIKGTEYADYILGNMFADNKPTMIAKKPSEAVYYCTLLIRDVYCSIWQYEKDSTTFYHVTEKMPRAPMIFTLDPTKVDEQHVLMVKNDPLMVIMRRAFGRGRMTFQNVKTRNAFVKIY